MNSDERREARLRTRRERRAAESSQQRETRLARRRVADRARYAARTARSVRSRSPTMLSIHLVVQRVVSKYGSLAFSCFRQ